MKYKITHTTSYSYDIPISLSFNQVRLKPRVFSRQARESYALTTSPLTTTRKELTDFFGNDLVFFTVQESHASLEVTASSVVDVMPVAIFGDEVLKMQCGEVKRQISESRIGEIANETHPYLYDSPFVKRLPEIADYASVTFADNRPYFEAVSELTRRIHDDFAYDPNATNIYTPLLEVIRQKKGVCQDFAHVALGCLHSMGFAARYVSGYLETLPPPGQQKLVGSDASHAWFSVYIPSAGWVDFDPTNNLLVSDQHITVAWGRDYGDVLPVNGVYWGNSGQKLSVSVDVARWGGIGPTLK